MKGFQELLRRYNNFCRTDLPKRRAQFQQLAAVGQKPIAMIVACSDSRVVPEVIFDSAPGELFSVRNVANLVPPHDFDEACWSVGAALEFAIVTLGIQHIIVMGHGKCGGISCYLENQNTLEQTPMMDNNFIARWIKLLKPAEQYLSQFSEKEFPLHTRMEYAGICQSIENLRGFPWIAEREKCGQLWLHGLWFDISSGMLLLYDEEKNCFRETNQP